MPTKFNLTIDSQTSGMQAGGSEGITQNTTIRSENPEELIAVLRKLSGLEEPQHSSHSITAGAPAQSSAPAQPLEVGAASMPHMTSGDCGGGTVTAVVAPSHGAPAYEEQEENDDEDEESEDEEGDNELAHMKRNMGNKQAVDEALANAPKPKTMKSLLDLVNTDHTARAPTKPVPAKSGDNPLADEDDEKSLLESQLMRDWQATKLQHYAESLNTDKAAVAIAEGAKSFIDGSREYAVRTQDGFIKVYPVIENRVMTQAPVYVVQEAFGRDMKHLVGDTGPGTGRGVSPELSRNNEFSPAKLADLDKPAIQRSGDMEEPVPHDLTEPKYDRMGRRKIREGENGETMTDVFNRYKRHFAMMHDSTEHRDQRQLSSTECKEIIGELQAKFPDEFNLVRDLKQYALYQEKYDQTQDLRFQSNAQRLLAKYENLSGSADTSNKEQEVEQPEDSEEEKMMSEALNLKDLRAAAGKNTSTKAPTKGKKEPKVATLPSGEVDLNSLKDKKVDEAKKKNKYAIGMAAAMKATGDKPPLKKSTITKAHEIAKAVKEGSKKKVSESVRGGPRDYVVVHNPDKRYRSIDPLPMSRHEAEQYADKTHNVVAMHIDDAMRMFADDADASWTLLKIKSTLREGDVVDLNKFRAKKQAAQDALQRSKTPPPDDDETAEVTLQSLFDKLIELPDWKRLKDKKNNARMESFWKNNSTGETITIVVPTVTFHSMRMNTPAIEITVYNNDLEIDGEEFYHSL